MAGFKTSARTLDLLGRQQIAGIPTAINELFKNAHDAYADYAEIDYFRQKGLFVLRDNGMGMTNEDFENRWLTLGTDSKHSNSSISKPYIDNDKPYRYITGEKGIGRLSIASIGRQVLILTRAKNEKGLNDTVVAFINWGIFELNGLTLDDIIIPTRIINGGNLPDNELIEELKNELIHSIISISEKRNEISSDCNDIINEIRDFIIIPSEIENKLPNPKLSLKDNGHGTHFYISPISEILDLDIDGEGDKQEATKIEKILMGFTNTMTPNHPQPQIELSFRDYKSDDSSYIDIINKDSFFSQEDFDVADHRIVGEFDEFGQFKGNVTVYQEKNYDHIVNWNGNNFRKTLCGSFKIDFAYVQGMENQTVIPKEEYSRITAKCDKYGGLYIYNDNIRILPYGDSDYDFIDIEKNRTKSAKYYFFSFRRMFGAIIINHVDNPELKEKAGREGFIENKAYRQMRLILKNFFVQLAADFFRENGGPKSEFWNEKRKEQDRISKALDKKEKQAKFRKDKFIKALQEFFKALNTNQYYRIIDEILKDARQRLSNVVYIKDSEIASAKILEIEVDTRQKIEEFKSSIKIPQPKGFTVNKRTSEDFDVYREEYRKLETNLFNPAVQRLDEMISEFLNRLQLEISKRKRLELSVDLISVNAQKSTKKLGSEANDAANTMKERVKSLTNQVMIDLDDKIRQVKDRFKALNINSTEDFNLVEERKKMEDEIIEEKDKATFILETILKQLDSIYWDKDENQNYVTNEEITLALQEQIYDLQDRITSDVELSQLGLAVGIIHHEFNSTVYSVRNSIKDLKAWADVNEKMESVYLNIRTNFEHLDSYLNMFTPLSRRLQRTNENIPATDIRLYVHDLFYPRFERHNIKLRHTKGFTKRSLYGFRSTFYPVFINIVDNAIHWLKEISTDERFVKLHADDNGFYISNNGPSISINDFERVFELGFSRKPKGRGMGLHISREALNECGYKLYLIEPLEECNVTFKIEKI